MAKTDKTEAPLPTFLVWESSPENLVYDGQERIIVTEFDTVPFLMPGIDGTDAARRVVLKTRRVRAKYAVAPVEFITFPQSDDVPVAANATITA